MQRHLMTALIVLDYQRESDISLGCHGSGAIILRANATVTLEINDNS